MKQEIPEYWALLDVALIHLRQSPLFEAVIPSKLFECMAMGVPVLHCVKGESAAIVQRSEAGVTLTPEDPEGLAEAVMALCYDRQRILEMGKCGRITAKKYDRDKLAERMLEMLSAVVKRGKLDIDATKLQGNRESP